MIVNQTCPDFLTAREWPELALSDGGNFGGRWGARQLGCCHRGRQRWL